MNQEQITLTQQAQRTYAKEGVLFMATEITVVEEASKTAGEQPKEIRADSQEEGRSKPTPDQIHRQVQQWKQRFEQQLNKALKKSKEEQIHIMSASPEEISKYLVNLNEGVVLSLLTELSLLDQRLQNLGETGDAAMQAKEIIQRKEEVEKLKEELTEEIHTRRERTKEQRAEEFQVEKSDVTKAEGSSVDAQVFETFQQYLGKEGVSVTTDPSATELTIIKTADGKSIVSVPAPTLENMIAVATQLGLGTFSERTLGNLSQLGKELMGAAAFLDKHVFSPDAIAVLYNAGSQLDQLSQGIKAEDVKRFSVNDPELFKALHLPELQPENMQPSLKEKILLNVLFGRHDLKISSEEKKLYDLYFRRWRRHNPNAKDLPIDKQQEAFDAYLVKEYINPDAKNNEEKAQAASNLSHLLNFLREPIEKSLKVGGKASRLIAREAQKELGQEMVANLLDPWRMLVDTTKSTRQGEDEKKEENQTKTMQEWIKEWGKRMKTLEGVKLDGAGLVDALKDFNFHFQPDEHSELLDYVPANLRARLAGENRDAIACIVAVAYEQKALQESLGNRYVVVPELTGTHATLLVVDLDGNNVVRVDPSVPKGYEQTKADLLKNGPRGPVVELALDDPYTVSILEEIDKQNPKTDLKIRQRERGMQINFNDLKGSEVQVSVQEKDARGVVHTAVAGDRLVTSALLSNMVAQGFIGEDKDVGAAQAQKINLAAAQQAVKFAPENPVAMKVLSLVQSQAPKGYLEDLVNTSEYYRKKADAIDKSLVGKEELEKLMVGEWRPPGGPFPRELQDVIDRANAELTALGAAQTPPILPGTPEFDALSLADLEMDTLKDYGDVIGELRKMHLADGGYVDKASKLLKQVNREFAKQRNSMGNGRNEDAITSFGLTPREQDIFSGGEDRSGEMIDFIENELLFFGAKVNPGGYIPTSFAQIAQSRLDDLFKILNANPNRLGNPGIEEAFRRAESYQRIIVSPVLVASDIESGDHRRREGAGEKANSMDSSGGHDALGQLLELHDGRAHMLADEMWRVMDQIRNENLKLIGKEGYKNVALITPAQYKKVRDGIIEKQFELANHLGVGRYTKVKEELIGIDPVTGGVDKTAGSVFKVWLKTRMQRNEPHDAAAIDAYLNGPKFDKDVEATLLQAITVDANFAHVEFIIDGRASAIGIRGDNPNVFDPTTNPFLDGQYKDNVRYDMFTASKKKVFREMRISRAAIYIRLRYGDEVWERLNPYPKQDKVGLHAGRMVEHVKALSPKHLEERTRLLDRFINLNGIELLTPATEKYWENTFIRTKPMVYTILKWREAKGKTNEHGVAHLAPARSINSDATAVSDGPDDMEFGLGLRLLVADPLVRPGGEYSEYRQGSNPEDLDPLMLSLLQELRTTNNDYYSDTIWGKYPDGETKEAYRRKALQFKLMEKSISVFYPEEMMKPFAYEPDMWRDSKGQKFDERFESFFVGAHTDFLDTVLDHMQTTLHKPNLGDEWTRDIQLRFGSDAATTKAQLRFKIFQEFVAPIMASVRSDNINGLDPNTHQVGPDGLKPRQTNFGGNVIYEDFNKLGSQTDRIADKFKDMMGAMTMQVRRTSGKHIDYLGRKIPNSLIGRLAYDPMMDHILAKSPITVADVPYWMMHGKDIYGEEHPFDIKDALGGENQVGRHIGDSAFVSKGREGILKVAMGNPAQIEETMIKPLLEEVTETIAGQKSRRLAAETELSVAGVLFRMMVPEAAELIGAESLPLMKNSRMRKIFGRQMRAMNEAQLKSIYQSQFMTRMVVPEYQALMQEILFGSKWRRRRRGLFKLFWAMFLVTLMQVTTTGNEMFQGELQNAGK